MGTIIVCGLAGGMIGGPLGLLVTVGGIGYAIYEKVSYERAVRKTCRTIMEIYPPAVIEKLISGKK